MYKIQSIFENDYHLTHQKTILDFCRIAFLEKSEPSHKVMYDDNWENSPGTLPYLIYKSDRFVNDNGDFFLLMEDDQIKGCAGVNILNEFDKNVAIAGVRTWLNKELRGKFIVGRYLLPAHLKWSKQKNLKTVVITLNEYNKRLIPYFKREGLGIKKNRTEDSMFYNGQHHLEFSVNLYHTKQYVMYHKIDEGYEPDWEQIRYDK